jgi:branched-subunit amino acid ABC-type transport system permease component
MYILAALGFAFIFNMLGAINLAHGALYMTAAYVTYYLCDIAGFNNWLAMLCSCIILIVLGLAIERYCFRPFYDSFKNIVMISVALMTILQTISILLTGAGNFSIPSFAPGIVDLGFMSVGRERIVMFAVGTVLLLITMFIVYRTKLGMQMSAVAQNRKGAALQGINVFRVSSLVFALGCALAAVSGSMMGAYQMITPFMGDNMQIRILMLVMLAGAGSMNGIIITGLIMAVADVVFPAFFQSFVAAALSIGIIVVLLLIRPKGFFGHAVN